MGIVKDNTLTAGMNELGPLIIEAVKNNSDVKITVRGYSMYPLFRHNYDRVLLSAASDIKKYDIVLYKRQNGSYVLHRVVKVSGDLVGMAGDNEQEVEFPILKTQVIAVVKGFWRGERYWGCKNILCLAYSRFWVAIMPKRYKMIALLIKLRRKYRGK